MQYQHVCALLVSMGLAGCYQPFELPADSSADSGDPDTVTVDASETSIATDAITDATTTDAITDATTTDAVTDATTTDVITDATTTDVITDATTTDAITDATTTDAVTDATTDAITDTTDAITDTTTTDAVTDVDDDVANRAPPAVTNLKIVPATATTIDTLSVTYDQPVDPDGDLLTVEIQWHVMPDDLVVSTLTVAPSATTRGQTWTVTATANDGSLLGPSTQASVTIVNAPAKLTGVSITPPSPSPIATVTAVPSGASDADGDQVVVAYQWFVAGLAAGTGVTQSLVGSHKGDIVRVVAKPTDGIASGASVEAQVVVANRAPTVTSVSIGPVPPSAAAPLEATVVAQDPDGDPLVFSYVWKVGGTVVAGASDKTLDHGFERDDSVTVTVSVADNDGGQTSLTSSAVVIGNAPPPVPRAHIEPVAPLVGVDALVCTRDASTSDADGDTLTFVVHWSVDGEPYASAIDGVLIGDTVPAVDTALGRVWACQIEASDGFVVRSAPEARAAMQPVVTQVESGLTQTCALRSDKTVACWGQNLSGESRPPPGELDRLGLGTGSTSCGVRPDHSIVCWGRDNDGQLAVPPGSFSDVVLGYSSACGLAIDGSVVCWGNNSHGQTSAPAADRFKALASSYRAVCGIKNDDTLSCWGATTTPSGTFTHAAGAQGHFCAIRSDQSLLCWGTYDEETHPSPPPGAFVAITSGQDHDCAIAIDGTIVCWGNDDYGQATPPPGTFVEVAAGIWHTCARSAEGRLVCWGDNYFGGHIAPIDSAVDVAVGDITTCIVSVAGTVACHGLVAPPPDLRLVDIALSDGDGFFPFACGHRDDGTVGCFGQNDGGQTNAPAGVLGPIGVGRRQTCARDVTGTLACWGDLGEFVWQGVGHPPGTFVDHDSGGRIVCGVTPTLGLTCWGTPPSGVALAPPAGIQWRHVSVGSNHVCGLDDDALIHCFGENDDGQANPPSGQYSAVSAGLSRSCALGYDGQATCWGAMSDTPPTGALTHLSVGRDACGLDATGGVWCWGQTARQPLWACAWPDVGCEDPTCAATGWCQSIDSVYAIQSSAASAACTVQSPRVIRQSVDTLGVVSVAPHAVSNLTGFILSDGTGPYSGVLVVAPSTVPLPALAVGDEVRVRAHSDEYFCLTELYATSVTRTGKTRPVPAAVPLAKSVTADTLEQYEGMLVSMDGLVVTGTNAQNDNTTDGPVLIDRGIMNAAFTPLGTGTVVARVTGVVRWSFNAYRISPRSSQDIQL